MPLFSQYVTESIKEDIHYGFWSRPTIPWKLECETTHSKESVIEAVKLEKDKEALNEVGVIWVEAIAYSGGFTITAITTILFYTGVCMCSE